MFLPRPIYTLNMLCEWDERRWREGSIQKREIEFRRASSHMNNFSIAHFYALRSLRMHNKFVPDEKRRPYRNANYITLFVYLHCSVHIFSNWFFAFLCLLCSTHKHTSADLVFNVFGLNWMLSKSNKLPFWVHRREELFFKLPVCSYNRYFSVITFESEVNSIWIIKMWMHQRCE